MKIVVAYSGGLDTSVIVKWLIEKYNAEIITATGFLGQVNEIKGVKEKAAKTGAIKSFVYDLREEFLTGYVWKALKAGALYEGEYPMATSIGTTASSQNACRYCHTGKCGCSCSWLHRERK